MTRLDGTSGRTALPIADMHNRGAPPAPGPGHRRDARASVRVVAPAVACQQARSAGLVVHRADPLNAETPLPALTGAVAPANDHFYVRNHFHIPALGLATWRLRIGGLAGWPLALSLAALRSMSSQTVVATLECAGNGRSGLDPAVPGEPWGLGAVGTAAWTGVPLTQVLQLAAPRAGARQVVFRGADRGQVDGRSEPVHFERSLPLSCLGRAGALLAYAMNGEPLPAAHGYSLRLIVPGRYGVASVKWLTSLELTSRAFAGHFQADRYHIGGRPLTLQAVRSLITVPRDGDTAGPGEVMVHGLAWSGAAPIARVEVSIGGQPWQPATLTGTPYPHGWHPWQLIAQLEEPGSVIIGPGPPTPPGAPSPASRPGTRSATPTTPSTRSRSAPARPHLNSGPARMQRPASRVTAHKCTTGRIAPPIPAGERIPRTIPAWCDVPPRLGPGRRRHHAPTGGTGPGR